MTGRAAALAALALLAACSRHDGDISAVLRTVGNEAPMPGSFRVCHDYGCRATARVSLSRAQWARVRALFPAGLTAAAERARLRRAIALLERFSGAQTGTRLDLGRSFAGFGRKGQMDCIDEMVNTATYLRLLERTGLLRRHRLDGYQYHGLSARRVWPHAGASIREIATGARFVVDSWLLDNGKPPFVVPYDEWWTDRWRGNLDAYALPAEKPGEGL